MPGRLAGLVKRLGGSSDESIGEEIAELELERTAILRDRGRHAETALAAADAFVRMNVEEPTDRELDRIAIMQKPIRMQPAGLGLPPPPVFWSGALGGPDKLRERLRERVRLAAERGDLCDTPLVELERREDEINAQIRERQVELERRRLATERDELAQREAALEEELAP